MKKIKCEACGKQNKISFKFCSQCGGVLPDMPMEKTRRKSENLPFLLGILLFFLISIGCVILYTQHTRLNYFPEFIEKTDGLFDEDEFATYEKRGSITMISDNRINRYIPGFGNVYMTSHFGGSGPISDCKISNVEFCFTTEYSKSKKSETIELCAEVLTWVFPNLKESKAKELAKKALNSSDGIKYRSHTIEIYNNHDKIPNDILKEVGVIVISEEVFYNEEQAAYYIKIN